MKTKEKALQLHTDFKGIIGSNTKTFYNEAAKQCALFCVDEILKNFEGLHKPEYCAFDAIGERKFTFKGEYDEHMTGYDMIKYWNEVKKEIKKL